MVVKFSNAVLVIIIQNAYGRNVVLALDLRLRFDPFSYLEAQIFRITFSYHQIIRYSATASLQGAA
jgi:hypothetical protein